MFHAAFEPLNSRRSYTGMRIILFCISALLLSSCDQLGSIIESGPAGTGAPPLKSQIAAGIREALVVGTRETVKQTSQVNGFYQNPKIRIPFPPEAEKVAQTARDIGLGNRVDQFVETLNRGAERAAEKATPIFMDAIKQMSIQDVYEIWRGDNDAATQYLRRSTRNQLKQEFRPVIKGALDQVDVTRYWNPIITAYNRLPHSQKVNPDLDEYVLNETLDGLFKMIAQEEAKIRENPQARVTDLLERVFGYLDRST